MIDSEYMHALMAIGLVYVLLILFCVIFNRKYHKAIKEIEKGKYYMRWVEDKSFVNGRGASKIATYVYWKEDGERKRGIFDQYFYDKIYIGDRVLVISIGKNKYVAMPSAQMEYAKKLLKYGK